MIRQQQKQEKQKEQEQAQAGEPWSRWERMISGMEQINRLVTAVLGIASILIVLIVTYSVFQQFQPKDASIHECATCKKTFVCKSKGKLNTKKKIHRFKRKTVQVGSFPLEVTKTENSQDFCCGSELPNGDRLRFCSFPCYIATQQTANNKN
jgi:hypothetical protein